MKVLLTIKMYQSIDFVNTAWLPTTGFMGDVKPGSGQRQDAPDQPRGLPAPQPQDADHLHHPLTLLHHQLNLTITGTTSTSTASPEWVGEATESETGVEEW